MRRPGLAGPRPWPLLRAPSPTLGARARPSGSRGQGGKQDRAVPPLPRLRRAGEQAGMEPRGAGAGQGRRGPLGQDGPQALPCARPGQLGRKTVTSLNRPAEEGSTPTCPFSINKTPLHVVPTGGPRRPASGPQGAREARGSRPHPHLPPSPVHVVVAVQVQDAAGHLAGHALQGDGVGGQGLRCPAAPQVALEVPLPTGAAASPAGGEWAPCRPTPQPFLPRANWGSCQAPRGAAASPPGTGSAG